MCVQTPTCTLETHVKDLHPVQIAEWYAKGDEARRIKGGPLHYWKMKNTEHKMLMKVYVNG